MKDAKFWIAVAVAGVAMNIVDYLVQGMWFGGWIYSKYPDLFSMDQSMMMYYVLGDFVGVAVLAWVYDKVKGSFSAGMNGGAEFGLYAGVLCSFPMWILAHITFKGFPYWVSWVFTIYGIAWGVIAGAIIARMMMPKASAS